MAGISHKLDYVSHGGEIDIGPISGGVNPFLFKYDATTTEEHDEDLDAALRSRGHPGLRPMYRKVATGMSSHHKQTKTPGNFIGILPLHIGVLFLLCNYSHLSLCHSSDLSHAAVATRNCWRNWYESQPRRDHRPENRRRSSRVLWPNGGGLRRQGVVLKPHADRPKLPAVRLERS
jgi:hypothetical protein